MRPVGKGYLPGPPPRRRPDPRTVVGWALFVPSVCVVVLAVIWVYF